MLDSTAKIPSGIMRGNIKNLGNFDECIDLQNDKVKSKYCLLPISQKFIKQVAIKNLKVSLSLLKIFKSVHSEHILIFRI